MEKKSQVIIKILLGIYLFFLIWIVLFKLRIDITEIYNYRRINIIPFYFKSNLQRHIIEMIENIILFIPFGLYLKNMIKDNKLIIIYGIITSFVFEMLQFIFALGATDITDIITNTFGVVLGLLAYKWLDLLFKTQKEKNIFIISVGSLCTITFTFLVIGLLTQ